jgi:hypothetical protein
MSHHSILPNRTTICLLVLVWFVIWGICPWNSSSSVAQAGEATHDAHGHHGDVDDTHHASKGTEHSCSGSISYSSKVQKERPQEQTFSVYQHPSLFTDPLIHLRQAHGYQKSLVEKSNLPKLLTEYYQLYSIYRI